MTCQLRLLKTGENDIRVTTALSQVPIESQIQRSRLPACYYVFSKALSYATTRSATRSELGRSGHAPCQSDRYTNKVALIIIFVY